MDALSYRSGVSGYSRSSVSTSQAMGGILASILSSLLMFLSTPILFFGGFILIYFYHVQSFGIVSDWFYVLPYAFYSCGAINFLASIFISIFQILPANLCKRLFLTVLCIFLVVSCLLNGISSYGCNELHSIILQQNFLSADSGGIMDQYMSDPSFQESWDDLQRQFFCCGVLLFNNGFLDWKNSYGKLNNSVPDSCCHVESLHCGSHVYDGSLPPMQIYTHGCMTVIQSKLENELTYMLLVFMVLSISMMMISLICLILSLCISHTQVDTHSPGIGQFRSHKDNIGQHGSHNIGQNRSHKNKIGQYGSHKENAESGAVYNIPGWEVQGRPSRYIPLPSIIPQAKEERSARNRPVDLYTTQESGEV